MHWPILAVSLFLLSAGGVGPRASAETFRSLENVEFKESLQLAGKTLKLNGLGVRKVAVSG